MKNAWTIYHNPKCSKSREALEILNSQNIEPVIIEYLKEPLTVDDFNELLEKLKVPAKSLVRTKDELYQQLQFELDSESEVLKNLVQHPALMERPIVTFSNHGVIARPPSETLELLFKISL